jgi:hypothetical protein
MAIWYTYFVVILVIFSVLVIRTKKKLATLLGTCCVNVTILCEIICLIKNRVESESFIFIVRRK